jgi:23S rRNA (guanosine2251-2'-O)-methyltransferase
MREICLIAHNLRSTHNVGSLFRTAEGLGVNKIYLTGYTPYPIYPSDDRLPHISSKLDRQINKTALGATNSIPWQHSEDISIILTELIKTDILVVALEQSQSSIPLTSFKAPDKLAIVLGSEVTGMPEDILAGIKIHIHIPMFGKKESYNVVQAAAMAIYEYTFH